MRFVAVAVLAACAGSQAPQRPPAPPAAPPPQQQADPWAPPAADEIYARLNGFTVEVCKCQETDCAIKVMDERNRYTFEEKQRYGEPSFSEPDARRLKQTQTEFIDCAKRVVVPEHAAKVKRITDEHRVVQPLAELRDRMCSCTDRECAREVADDTSRYVADVAYMFPISDEQHARAKLLMDKLRECELQVMKLSP